MTLSPRLTLALALAAGLATPALAQTAAPNAAAPTSAAPGWNSQHPGSSYATQPQGAMLQAMPAPPSASSSQPQASYNPAQPNGQMPPNSAQAANSPTAADSHMQFSPGMQAPDSQRVSQAQAQLRAAGLYNGPQDGVMDPDTRAAIARFQEQHKLPRTERLDPRTTAALTGNQTTGSGSSMSSAAPPASQNEGQTGAPTGAGGMSGSLSSAQPTQPTQPMQH